MKKFPYDKGFEGLHNSNVEKLETVVTPSGNLYEFDTNKSHAQGGLDIYLEPESFVFSHKLKSGKDVAYELTGHKYNRKPSFADLSKRFPTDKLKAIIEDPTQRYDSLSKKTASIQIEKHRGLLRTLAESQESLKNNKGMSNDLHTFKNGGYKQYQGGGYENYSGLYSGRDTQRLYDDNLIMEMNLPNIHSLNNSINNRVGDVRYDQQGRRFKTIYTDATNPYFQDGTHHSSALITGKSTYLGNNQSLFNQEDYLQNRRYNDINDRFQGKLNDELSTLEREYLKRVSPDRVPDINAPTYLDKRGRGYNEDNQDQIVTVLRREDGIANPLPVNNTIQTIPIGEGVTINTPPASVPDTLDSPQYQDNLSYYDEVPVGMDPRKLINGVQQGLLLTELATLERENPYYTGTTLKVANKRFDPVNTKQAERAYNIAKESIENGNLPSSIKQARLGQIEAQLFNNIGQVDIQNSQGDLQNDNFNNQNIINTSNQNAQNNTQANYRYMQERARGRALQDQQRQNIVGNAMDIWRKSKEQDMNIDLINQLSRNYNFSTKDGVQYEAGQGVNPRLNNPLNPYGGGSGLDLSKLNEDDLSKYWLHRYTGKTR